MFGRAILEKVTLRALKISRILFSYLRLCFVVHLLLHVHTIYNLQSTQYYSATAVIAANPQQMILEPLLKFRTSTSALGSTSDWDLGGTRVHDACGVALSRVPSQDGKYHGEPKSPVNDSCPSPFVSLASHNVHSRLMISCFFISKHLVCRLTKRLHYASNYSQVENINSIW